MIIGSARYGPNLTTNTSEVSAYGELVLQAEEKQKFRFARRGVVNNAVQVDLARPERFSHARIKGLGILGDRLAACPLDTPSFYPAWPAWLATVTGGSGLNAGQSPNMAWRVFRDLWIPGRSMDIFLGSWQSTEAWDALRGSGFEYAWAKVGLTASEAEGDALAALVEAGQQNRVDHCIIWVGSERWFPGSDAWTNTVLETWDEDTRATGIAELVASVATIAMAAKESQARPVVVNMFPYEWSPVARYLTPVAEERGLVFSDVTETNDQLDLALEGSGIPRIDIQAWSEMFFGEPFQDEPMELLLGGHNEVSGISWEVNGVDPGSVVQALWACLIGSALNEGYDARVPLLSEQEITEQIGLPYAQDSLPEELRPENGVSFVAKL